MTIAPWRLGVLAGLLTAVPARASGPSPALLHAAAISSQLLPGGASAVAMPEAPSALVQTAAVSSARSRPTQPLPNFHQVTSTLFRSGQPDQSGVAQLAQQGVKTILKLNADDPAEVDWAAAAGLGFQTVLMDNKHSPTFQQIDQALAIINDPASQPVDVHCHLGHDRTGAVVAAYRVTVQGWSVDQAAQEALNLGYSAPGFDDITSYLNGYLQYRSGK